MGIQGAPREKRERESAKEEAGEGHAHAARHRPPPGRGLSRGGRHVGPTLAPPQGRGGGPTLAPPQGRGGGSGEEELEESKRERER